MTDRPIRQFTSAEAVRADVPLLAGITGASASGKTYSALSIATGVQQIRGGDIHVIDTEGGRARHYADLFRFRHVPFSAPFSPLDYLDAINYCANQGARIIVVDSMSHEHEGDGGVLEQIEDYLQRKAGDNFDRRDRLKFSAQIIPKAQRKQLNQRILQLTDITFVFCYRAHEKIRLNEKTVDGKKMDPQKGWAPISTSPLFFDMTIRFLLPPGSDGRPVFNPSDEAEKMLVKLPQQFREWFKPGDQLTAEIGAKLATWAKGSGAQTPAPATKPEASPPPVGPQTRHECQVTVANVWDKQRDGRRVYCIRASDGNDYWTADGALAERARVAAEVEAPMLFAYHGGSRARYIDEMSVAK